MRLVSKLSVHHLEVSQTLYAEEPSLSDCQIGPESSCGKLGVFRAPVVAIHNATAIGH